MNYITFLNVQYKAINKFLFVSPCAKVHFLKKKFMLPKSIWILTGNTVFAIIEQDNKYVVKKLVIESWPICFGEKFNVVCKS